MIRGPGILPNMENDHPIINIDLAPTILKMAGLTPPHDMDGIPIPVFNQINDEETFEYSISTNSVNIDDLYDREMLIEYSGEGRSNNYSDCPVGNDKNLFVRYYIILQFTFTFVTKFMTLFYRCAWLNMNANAKILKTILILAFVTYILQ